MIELLVPLQEGMTAALKTWPALRGAFPGREVPVYDVVPTAGPKADPPDYIVIGDDQEIPDDAEGIEGADVFVTVHVWSRTEPRSTKRSKWLAGLVVDCLTEGFTIDGFILMQAELESKRPLLDPGDQSGHCVVTFRLMIEPAIQPG